MPRIFVSFRKTDERVIRGRIYQRLVECFGADQVFKSGNSITPGSAFAEILMRQAADCEVMLVLIGPGWLATADESGQRLLDREHDWVRTEIRTALRSGNTVLPVLIGEGVRLPDVKDLPSDIARLTGLQFCRIEESRVDTGLNELVKTLTTLLPDLEGLTTVNPVPENPAGSSPVQRGSGNQSLNIGGSANGPVVQGSGNQTAGRDIKSKNVKKKGNPFVIVVALLVILGVVFVLSKVVPALADIANTKDGGLTGSSTCQQFLDTDDATEQQALVDIATSMNIGGFGSPLALPEIRYECSSEPSATIGSVIQRDQGEF